MNDKRGWKSLSFWLYFFPPTFWLVFFFFIPLGILWLYSYGTTNEMSQIDIVWTWDNYLKTLHPIYLKVITNSFLLAGLTTAICMGIGFFIALFISFSDPRRKNLWLILIILPFWTNLLIRVFGVNSILREQGVINNLLHALYNLLHWFGSQVGLDIFTAGFKPLELLYNNGAVIVGLVYVSLPFMVLPIYSSMDKLDRDYIEASLDLGASHTRTLLQIVAPMVRPGLISGFVLTFIPNLGVFIIPDMLGSPDTLMIGNVIQRQFGEGQNWPLGSALAFILIYLTFFGFAANSLLALRTKKKSSHA